METGTLLRRGLCVAVLAAPLAMSEPLTHTPLDPAALDRWWDFDHPAASEATFREELARLPQTSAARLELLTQLARAQGLQRRFGAADATLAEVERMLSGQPAVVKVRYLLERGRVLNSSKRPDQAVPLFREALDLARQAHEDFLAIDAAHMLGIAAPLAERLRWNLEAVAMTERTDNARAKRWLASLYNNIGWTYHDRGEYALALAYFERALPQWEARGEKSAIRAARWSIGRGLRSLERYHEALTIQEALLAEIEKSGETDGYVYEEIGELHLARGDAAQAKPWFAKAYAALAQDVSLKDTEPARIERLRQLAEMP